MRSILMAGLGAVCVLAAGFSATAAPASAEALVPQAVSPAADLAGAAMADARRRGGNHVSYILDLQLDAD